MCATSSKATGDPGGLIDRKLSACIFTLHVISPACYGWMLDLSMHGTHSLHEEASVHVYVPTKTTWAVPIDTITSCACCVRSLKGECTAQLLAAQWPAVTHIYPCCC